jgi:diguanylate cyclase (GGDEF)-like protein/hemerythrin-like metal-binding protein
MASRWRNAPVPVIALLLLAVAPLDAEEQGWAIKQWTTAHGLPQSSVTSLTQTPDGYLWVGTSGGLVRFDGIRFQAVPVAGAEGSEELRISAIAADPSGTVWVGTDNGGAYRLTGGVLRRLASTIVPEDASVQAVAASSTGVWFGYRDHGLAVVRGDVVEAVPGPSVMRSSSITGIAATGPGQIVVAGEPAGLYRGTADRMERLTADPRSLSAVGGVVVDSRGVTWASSDGGLFRLLEGGRVEALAGVPSSFLARRVEPDGDGGFWIGAADGLSRLRSGTLRTVPLGLPTAATILSILRDREGSVFVGTARNGLFQLHEAPFAAIGAAEGLPPGPVLAITGEGDGGGTVYASVACKGVARIRGERLDLLPIPEGECPTSLHLSRDGSLLVGTPDSGVYFRKGDSFVRLDIPGLAGASSFLTDSHGRIWIGSRHTGVFVSEGPLSSFRSVDGTGLPSPRIRDLAEDLKGRIWVATRGGLAVLEGGRFRKLGSDSGVPEAPLRAVLADDDLIWVASQGAGLVVGDGERFWRLGTAQGLHENVVSWVHRVGEWIWWTGNRGTYRALRSELLSVARSGKGKVVPRRFTAAEGMPADETNGVTQPAGWASPDGRLYIPTIAGIAVLDPNRVPPRRPAPPVVIQSVRIDGAEVDPGAAIELRAAARRVEISFTAMTLLAPERLRFRTRLQEIEPAWVDEGTKRTVTYERLPAGRSTFEVTAVDESELTSLVPARLTIVRNPALHERPSVRLLAALLTAVIVGGVWRLRSAALRKRSALLERMVEEKAGDLTRANRELADTNDALARAKQELEEANRALDQLASTDRLTGAWNRRHLDQALAQETGRSRRRGEPLTLLALDLDRFKAVNDRHGHKVGDDVLAEVVQRVCAAIRVSDTLIRTGGEEFLVLLPGTGLADAVSTAERIRLAVSAAPIAPAGTVTVSLGVAEYLPDREVSDWLERADEMLYAAKRAGRNKVLWDPAVVFASSLTGSDRALSLEWDSSFESGNETLDEQHRFLHEKAKRLLESFAGRLPAPAPEPLPEFLSLMERHFADEEAALEAAGWPGLSEHRALHASLLLRVQALTAGVSSGQSRPEDLVAFVTSDLLSRHLIAKDRLFFDFLRRPPQASGPFSLRDSPVT